MAVQSCTLQAFSRTVCVYVCVCVCVCVLHIMSHREICVARVVNDGME